MISENTRNCQKAERTEDAEVVGKTAKAKDPVETEGQWLRV